MNCHEHFYFCFRYVDNTPTQSSRPAGIVPISSMRGKKLELRVEATDTKLNKKLSRSFFSPPVSEVVLPRILRERRKTEVAQPGGGFSWSVSTYNILENE